MPFNQADIVQILSKILYPGYSRDIVSFGMVKSVEQKAGKWAIRIELPSNSPRLAGELRPEIEKALGQVSPTPELIFSVREAPAPPAPPQPKRLDGVKKVIAIASGKGGVGKTTVAVNLALALARAGKSVGLLDADMHGPSVPLMLGLTGEPIVEDGKLLPFTVHSVKVMSMALLIDENTPVVWRGPMINKSIQQFISQVNWGELDILVVDLPPGTGDAQLTLAQTLIVDEALIVTAPSLTSVKVAIRGAAIWKKLAVPIAGVVENFSYYALPDSTRDFPLGKDGGKTVAQELGVSLLAELPIDPALRQAEETGNLPPDPSLAPYDKLAQKLL